MNQPINTNGFKYKKSLGQNFIFDTNLLNAIASDAGITSGDTVLEVGVGAATLTKAIAVKAKNVIAVEVDKDLQPIIQKTLADTKNVKLVFNDILKLTALEIAQLTENNSFKMVANLPYYITTPIIFHILESDLKIQSMTLTVQKEVALRMTASPSTPDYGALTLAIAARANAIIARQINKNMFTPKPNVDSAVVRLDILRPFNKMISKTIKCLFAMRRKTALNNLLSGFNIDKQSILSILQDLKLDPNIRGENLNLANVTDITKKLCALTNVEFK